MKTFTAVTYDVPARSFGHPDRHPPSCPAAPTRRHALLLDRIETLDADPLCRQEPEPAIQADLRIRLQATRDGGPQLSRNTALPSRTEPSARLPLRVDFAPVPR